MSSPRTTRIARWILIGFVTVVVVIVGVVALLRVTNPRVRGQIGWLRALPMPNARGEAASAMAGPQLVVAGGFHGVGRTSRAVSVFDLRQRQWVIAPQLPQPRHHAAAAALDNWVYVGGGGRSATDDTPADTVWRARPGGRWSPVERMPEGRSAHAMVAVGSKLYAFGGVGRTARTLVYDPRAGWTTASPLPEKRDHLRAVVWGDEVWVLGGRSSRLTGRVDIYRPASDSWRRGPDLPIPMSAMAVGVLDDGLHVVGGENPRLIGGRVLPDHYVLREKNGDWERRPRPLLPVHGAGFGAYQGVMFVAGGASRQGALSVVSWTGVTQVYSTIPQKRV